MEYVLIFISSIFVNNIVLSQFLGICPFLGVSKKISTAMGMGTAVVFVMTLATITTHIVYHQLLVPNDLAFMTTVAFILVIASLVQMLEIMLKKIAPALYGALGIFLPLITTNCAILGVAILVLNKNYDMSRAIAFAIANGVGFTLAIVLFAGLRERLDEAKIPNAIKGAPISLIIASLLSMAFMGFVGIGS